MLSKEELILLHHYLKEGLTKTTIATRLGISRRSQIGQTRAIMTCSVTWTEATGISITSLVRCTHPPVR